MISPSRRKHVRFHCPPPRSFSADSAAPPSSPSLTDNLSGSGTHDPESISSEESLTSWAAPGATAAPSTLSLQKPHQQKHNPLRSFLFGSAQSQQHQNSIISSSRTFPITHRLRGNSHITHLSIAPTTAPLISKAGKTAPFSSNRMDDPLYFGATPSGSKSTNYKDDSDRVHVRRVSLAEFTGLEEFNKRKERSPKHFVPLEEPIKEDTGKSTQPATSLIDTYSNRRRSTATCSLEDIAVSTSPRMSLQMPSKEPEHIDFHIITERVENLRKRLEKTMNDLPNQSPKKSFDSENEKAELLTQTRRLAGACKTMASVMSDEESQKKWPQIVDEVAESADRVTSITERIVRKSNSVFQAQLMTAKTDQMLKSLLEVLRSLEEVQEKAGDSMKKLTARSTTLTATITQLISTVRSV